MPVNENDVKYIARLAHLSLSEKETLEYTHKLNDILKYVEKLNELDTENVEPLAYPVEMTNVFREDIQRDSTPREQALRNAPDRGEEYFRVPKVINVE